MVATRRLNDLIAGIYAHLPPPKPMIRVKKEKGPFLSFPKANLNGFCDSWSAWNLDCLEIVEEGAATVRFSCVPSGEWMGDQQTVEVLLPERIYPLTPLEAAWVGVDVNETESPQWERVPPRLYWGTAEDRMRVAELAAQFAVTGERA